MNRKKEGSFEREVEIAKENYRKKRMFIFFIITFSILLLCLGKIYMYHQEKEELQKELLAKKEEIKKLEQESNANNELIAKLKNPYFISDLVRQEYSMSYPGEIIFSLPLKESFIENSINSVMQSGADKYKDNKYVIDEKKIEDINKELEKERQKKEKEKEKELEKVYGEVNRKKESNRQ